MEDVKKELVYFEPIKGMTKEYSQCIHTLFMHWCWNVPNIEIPTDLKVHSFNEANRERINSLSDFMRNNYGYEPSCNQIDMSIGYFLKVYAYLTPQN